MEEMENQLFLIRITGRICIRKSGQGAFSHRAVIQAIDPDDRRQLLPPAL